MLCNGCDPAHPAPMCCSWLAARHTPSQSTKLISELGTMKEAMSLKGLPLEEVEPPLNGEVE